MKLIVLEGYANQGKTTVLMKLFHKLCALYKCKYVVTLNNFGDILAIFEIKDKIVGLATLGDLENELNEAFNIFENENCDLVIVACHKKDDTGKSKSFILNKEKTNKTQIVWYTKAFVKQYNNKYNAGKEIDQINDIQASMLLEEIKLQTV